MLCEVYLLDVPYHIDRPFDYSFTDGVKRGDIVRVPFGKSNSLRLGVVTLIKEGESCEGIKPVHSVAKNRFSLNEEMLGLCLFLKEHTLCTFGDALRAVVPSSVMSKVICS